jgi:hypothetical protein
MVLVNFPGFDGPPDPARWIALAFCWPLLEAEGKARDAYWRTVAWTKNWSPDRELIGLVGEVVYALQFGWPGALVDRPRVPDGGRDFRDVDVKGDSHWQDPLLKRDKRQPFGAGWYCLVAVDLVGQRGYVVGEASRAAFRAAPLRDFGYGPAHVLTPAQLAPASHPDTHPVEAP